MIWGPWELFIVFAIIAGAVSAARRRGVRTLVLQEFSADQQTGEVRIVGRSPGIVAWFLTLIGLDNRTFLVTDARQIRFRTASLFGQMDIVVPVNRCASMNCGYAKPIGLLILAGVFVLAAFVLAPSLSQYYSAQMSMRRAFDSAPAGGYGYALILMLIPLGLALFCAVLYALRKSISMTFETNGGMIFGLKFRRSIIENVPVDIDRARYAIDLITHAILLQSAPRP
jgi:hypothetical protein